MTPCFACDEQEAGGVLSPAIEHTCGAVQHGHHVGSSLLADRLTRAELEAEHGRTSPACTCARAELERFGCHCPAAHAVDDDEPSTPVMLGPLRAARAVMRST